MFNCNAWINVGGLIDQLILDKKRFEATRPLTITAFILEVIETNNNRPDGPVSLNDIEISVETLPTVPNWQP